MPILYIVATPIGNLEDVSLRALRVLKEAGLIAAEDTRRTRHLLAKYDVKTPVTSYHEHNKLSKMDYILKALESGDVALVSDAGMPGISDPGYELISAAIERGVNIIPVPGPSAVITALAVSGLPTQRFIFLGFLPRKLKDRQKEIESVSGEAGTIIIMEAPHRLGKTLDDISAILGDRKIAVCRELTKIHEEVFRGTLSQAKEHFKEPRGEFTLVIEGNREEYQPKLTGDIESYLTELYQSGMPAKEAVARISGETGLSRKELYQAWLKINRSPGS